MLRNALDFMLRCDAALHEWNERRINDQNEMKAESANVIHIPKNIINGSEDVLGF
jgi:hypothetical protein